MTLHPPIAESTDREMWISRLGATAEDLDACAASVRRLEETWPRGDLYTERERMLALLQQIGKSAKTVSTVLRFLQKVEQLFDAGMTAKGEGDLQA